MKDRIVAWFLRNIVLPKLEDIENPGFIVLKLSDKNNNTYLREIMFPEDLLVDIEREIVCKHGEKGKQILYSVGKRFGWEYASMSGFAQKKPSNKKDFLSFSYELVRYIECSFASKLKHEIDLTKDMFRLHMDDFVICNKNGLGYLMSSGGIAGIWAYMLKDPTIEGVEPKCQGRGDKMCEIICARPSTLKEMKLKPHCQETKLTEKQISSDYIAINKISPVENATKSLKDMVSSGTFEYSHGIMTFQKYRYFLLESGCIYLIEEALRNVKGGGDLLFDLSYEFGKSIVSENQNFNFITDYLSALGWGDVSVVIKDKSYSVISTHYPWTEYSDKSDFIIFRGMVSGLLSKILKKEVRFKNVEKSLSSGHLDIILS